MDEAELKKKLTPEQYAVLREKGTELPFTGKYVNEKKGGVYKCMACGNSLFSSDAKFDSGTGWPSFDEALPGAVEFVPDDSHGMHRTEVVCANCKSHLGHIFDDPPSRSYGRAGGPGEVNKRYCINSVCLDLEENR